MPKKPKKKTEKKLKLKKKALPDLPAKEGSESVKGGRGSTFAPPYTPVGPAL